MNKISNEIFRAYDIRGIVDTQINESLSYNIGRAYGTYSVRNHKNRIAVSGDVRPSTKKLKKL